MSLRAAAYQPAAHRDACLALFDGNVAGPGRPGGTFVPAERAELAAFLDALPGPFVVLVDGAGAVVACGGIAAEEEPGLWAVCWTIVAADRQGEGVGRALLEGLVEEARRAGAVALRLETVPATRGFFEASGFRAVEVDPEGYGPDMPPRVEMLREL